MTEGVVFSGLQSQGQSTPEERWLTAPSSIYGIKASGLERLRVCVRAYAYIPLSPYRFEFKRSINRFDDTFLAQFVLQLCSWRLPVPLYDS